MANIRSDCLVLFDDHYFEYYSSETHSNEVEAISLVNEKLTPPALSKLSNVLELSRIVLELFQIKSESLR